MTYLEQYWDLIRHNEIVTGYWIRKEIGNLIEDLQDSRYVYDTERAHKRIDFMQKFCLQSKAPYYKKPLVLMPWQLAWFEALYSFKENETGHLRFIEGLLEIARKNGKSSMLAADGMTDLFVGEGGMDICCASNDDRQARLIWESIGEMREKLDGKKALTGQNLTKIWNRRTSTTLFRLSSKTQNKDGFNISKTFLDESHDISEQNGQSEIAEACWRGMSSRDEPLFINCTTQGFNRECYLDKKIQYSKAVINKEIEDERLIAFLFEQDSEQEIWQDERSWEKSNPSIRYGVKKVDKLRRDVEIAKTDKATRIHCLTKDFNIAQSSGEAWLMLDDYAYLTEPINLDDFRNSWYLGAVDLSATTDLTAARILFQRAGDPTKYCISHYWIPESKLEKSDDHEAGATYADWARDGYITICEGNENDITQVADWFFEFYKNYQMKPYKIGYDQRFSNDFLNRADQYQMECEMLWQGRYLSNSMKLTEADFKSKIINYGGNPVDAWCFGNCCVLIDNTGNIQPCKSSQKSRRIDGALTMIMAEEVFRRYRAEYATLIGG